MTIRACATLAGALLVAGLAAGAHAALPHKAKAPVRRLSDADLVRYAASRFDKPKMAFRRQVIGVHRGTLVVAEFPCSDVCPAATRRIIHYDVPVSGCRKSQGVVVEELVPVAIAVTRRSFCEPAVIAHLPRKD